MKRNFILIWSFLSVVLMLSAFAQSVSNETLSYSSVVTSVSSDTADTSIMTNGLGIKIRTLQLQERIELAIYQARTITTKLSSVPNITTVDKTAIYNAVTTLTQLKAKVILLQTMTDKTNATAQFVELKKQAITAVQSAREVTQRVFTEAQKADIKNKIHQLEIDALKLTRQKIKLAINERNDEIKARLKQNV